MTMHLSVKMEVKNIKCHIEILIESTSYFLWILFLKQQKEIFVIYFDERDSIVNLRKMYNEKYCTYIPIE